MLLPFSRTFNEKPTNFKQKIQAFEKIHTFRLGHRFKPGDLLHFWDGAPRNRYLVPKAEPFTIPINGIACYKTVRMESVEVLVPCVYATENFKMVFEDVPGLEGIEDNYLVHFTIEGRQSHEIDKLSKFYPTPKRYTDVIAQFDGFDSTPLFLEFFNTVRKQKKTNVLEGQIIHWTKFTYTDKANIYKP